ncbi:hypothetical protein [Arthrobacter sp. 260]|uniref:hypothetical protein n=1 Tax=Arthrobacter sp. 260 TaxID=2735314 RepID=UPI001492A594|nr:hypothetical protein [Arthrobacter sp. 260]NOJ60755.1 hypothetical protein [Arthrobacter sp. 260]
MTSYGQRVSRVHLAIESVGRGTLKPSRLILWLDDPEAFRALPRELVRLQARGLEVRLTENLGPHTKYYPYVASLQAHHLPLVTADDDIVYPRRWLHALYASYLAHPLDISCHWANRVKTGDNTIADYAQWLPCRSTEPRSDHFALGVSGVIYPPMMLDALARLGTRFTVVSPTADDIWLHWAALQTGLHIRQVSKTPRHFPLIPGTQQVTLRAGNVEQNGNDRWISGLYTAEDLQLLTAVPTRG